MRNIVRYPEQGAAIVEWLFVTALLVVMLTSFLTVALPKIQAYAAKTVIETTMLDRISITPPQLGVISGDGNPINGLTPLNLINPAGFDQRVNDFFSTLKTSVDPEVRSYGFDPNDFEYCLVLKFQGDFETEIVAGQPTLLSRSSAGLGMRCSETLTNMLTSASTTQWAFLHSEVKWLELSLIRSAYASPISQEFIAIIGARDNAQKVCPTGACIAAGPVAGLEEPPLPPDTTPTPENTPTTAPTVPPISTPTPAPTTEPSPVPVDTITSIPTASPSARETETAISTPSLPPSPTAQSTATLAPSPTLTPQMTLSITVTVAPTVSIAPTESPVPTSIPTRTPPPSSTSTPVISNSPTPIRTLTPLPATPAPLLTFVTETTS
jgi:hypothetical protein